MTSVHLYWFRHPSGNGNFGDELGPWLVNQFTPSVRIRWFDPLLAERPAWVKTAATVRSVLRGDPKDVQYAQARSLLPPPTLLTAGSIIRRARAESITVWGSGAISRADVITAGHFKAVRGHLTRELLLSQGLEPPEIVGDPGLLVPLLLGTDHSQDFPVGIIPHFQHHEALRDKTPRDMLLIDLTWDLSEVVAAIARCELVVSTSLHGIIISHALGVPALWASFEESESSKLAGDGIKFLDYYSSVDLSLPTPIPVGSLHTQTVSSFQRAARELDGQTLPQRKRIVELQRDLLLSAPYPMSESPIRRALLENLK